MLYRNQLFDDLASPALAYIPYGGIDFGEAEAIAQKRWRWRRDVVLQCVERSG
jgi:hypothetical protein